MRFWASPNARAGNCSGRFLKRALFLTLMAGTFTFAQTQPKPATKKAPPHRANEFTLAGLRPGRDKLEAAKKLYGNHLSSGQQETGISNFEGECTNAHLQIKADSSGTIQDITVTDRAQGRLNSTSNLFRKCADVQTTFPYKGLTIAQIEFRWRTGRGIVLGACTSDLLSTYGEPDSRSPSTKDGQPLELWYYAFGWAGPDVPQVMEVLCTKERDGQPGRVEEITLAAPSL